MAKFKVKVKIVAECEYVVELDSQTETAAEQTALSWWRARLPSDFQVEKGYITGWETESEQQTAECPECGVEHSVPTADQNTAECWSEDQDYCLPCGAKIEVQERGTIAT